MRFAYADPPYPGTAYRFYGCEEVSHKLLLVRLRDEFPDGWALSTNVAGLREVLLSCPGDVRIGAWCKTQTINASAVRASWEPLLWCGGRDRSGAYRTRDWHVSPGRAPRILAPEGSGIRSERVDLHGITYTPGFQGIKHEDFCFWVFRILGMRPDDEFHDLFPGSGAVTAAWNKWRTQGVLWRDAR